ncbi:MAG: UDP-N-acetylmuramate dehydrogenase [Clostridiaceae bacterium]|nr:UDP-N-acetylmuramate dehydrogenase [Clostridiaceae bacterium]
MKDIFERSGTAYRENEPLSRHTSFRIGGSARYFAEPASALQIAALLEDIRRQGLPFFIMGNGSNLLAPDEGFDGVVIALGEKFSSISCDGNVINACAGALLSRIANTACENSLTGFEFAHGIPGSLGGGVYMNAGAYGGEMRNVIKEIEYLDDDLKVQKLSVSSAEFGYRTSIFKRQKGWIILSASISLEKDDGEKIAEKMHELAARRRDKQPLEYPSAGSTFKRPEGHFAAKLIEDCGLKGTQVGGAMVSPKHAGFIVNAGGATFGDVQKLIQTIKDRVMDICGVKLECEVEVMKPFAD